ncbi:aliphatic sulfonate ABC transporter substrate-binding protein [Heliobacterium chlorum]|uniref:Aliphatic sulfonate ABC transporter substrate-binding protein n=1 Tax=Heliobacterium chlorum TaxID=2698 RepID=A0ABR7T5H6_HELCL|nr:aliphatic sulfonate ABC transporter substrate-binding protein [Heliobacterium chlorum]MBC9785487.1 aliphatic sulfonate ABC transporter substrate-binding protein [Heliobacterium chlorum]
MFGFIKGKRLLAFLALATTVTAGILAGCSNGNSTNPASTGTPPQIKLDYAYYNPVSLVLKEKGFLEEAFAKEGTKIDWVLSLGSNKSLELLNSKSVDFGSTAGAAALIGKANGNPIKSVYIYSKPEWTALVVKSGSPIHQISDLKGKKIAVTRGTDPHIFLLRALERNGLTDKDVQIVTLQHPDGKNALEKGDVDAWAGLDPHMAQTEVESGSELIFRDPDMNTYGFLNVREEFAQKNPDTVIRVLQAYEKARKWAIEHPAEFLQIVEKEAKLTEPVAKKVLERTDLKNPAIGDVQKDAIIAAGNVMVKSGIVNSGTDIAKTAADLIDPQYVQKLVKE